MLWVVEIVVSVEFVLAAGFVVIVLLVTVISMFALDLEAKLALARSEVIVKGAASTSNAASAACGDQTYHHESLTSFLHPGLSAPV